MLGPLEYEIPPEMGEADQGVGLGRFEEATFRLKRTGHVVQRFVQAENPSLESHFVSIG
jgi:hypothetical protein